MIPETKKQIGQKIKLMLILGAFIVWSVLIVRTNVYSGDTMVGFHPIALATMPIVMFGIVLAVIELVKRRWQIAAAYGTGALALLVVFFNLHDFEKVAWRRVSLRHHDANRSAINSIRSDLPWDKVTAIWQEENLTPLENFQWYGTNHIAAPNGVYFGFRMGGVPHVRIQKTRHGWRGIAFVDGPSGFASLEGQAAISCSRVEPSNWLIWDTKD